MGPSDSAQSRHSGTTALSKHDLTSISCPPSKGAGLSHFIREGNRLGEEGKTEVKAGPWQPRGEKKSLETGGQALGSEDQAGRSGAAGRFVGFEFHEDHGSSLISAEM